MSQSSQSWIETIIASENSDNRLNFSFTLCTFETSRAIHY